MLDRISPGWLSYYLASPAVRRRHGENNDGQDCVRHLTYQLYALNELSLCRGHRWQMTWNCDTNTVKYCIVLLLFREIREEIRRKDRKRKKEKWKESKGGKLPKESWFNAGQTENKRSWQWRISKTGEPSPKVDPPIIFAIFPEHCRKLDGGFVSLAVNSDLQMNCNRLILHQ